ncbi:hypothetical protein GC093_04780 [Paenibacillus sp. LMG 31456]|uniref:Uncharacterized protein n=1 Tax=Paenibacillus foliorum TaxID=2654974 RepID=A0A972GKT5_9BACL|nr:hypothetical protein [Paenibacillus foliorum]
MNVKNIRVREKGVTPSKLKGYNNSTMINNITFDNIVMPGSPTSATNLSILCVYSINRGTMLMLQ